MAKVGILTFGKHAGKALVDLDQGYLEWMERTMGSSRWGVMARQVLQNRGEGKVVEAGPVLLDQNNAAGQKEAMQFMEKVRSAPVLLGTTSTINPSGAAAVAAVPSSNIMSVIVPFGKYKGRPLVEADDAYLRWMRRDLPLEWGPRATRALQYRARFTKEVSEEEEEDADDDIVALLKACNTLEHAQDLHARVAASPMNPAGRLFFSNLVLEAYGNCGGVGDAVALFHSMQQRNATSWKSIIKACLDNGHLMEARQIFDAMPDDIANELVITCTTMVVAYSAAGYPLLAKAAFDRIGTPDVVAWTSMAACYANHGYLEEAKATFDNMPSRNVVPWNGLVSALSNHGLGNEAEATQALQPAWDQVSLDLKFSCSATGAGGIDNAKAAFDVMPGRGIVTWTNMMRSYASNELLKEAGMTFDRMPMHNTISSIVGINCCVGTEQARFCFDSMKEHDMVSWTALLAAYAVHGHPGRMAEVFSKMPKHDMFSSTTVLFGYARVGYMEETLTLFQGMPERDVMSWTALFAGYAQDGRAIDAMELLHVMLVEGVEPNAVCFGYLLAACSHVGKVKDGRGYFLSMRADHGMEPDIEHYCCMVDILGRAGHLDDAEELVGSMPFLPNTAVLHALAGACRSYKDDKRVERVFALAVEMDSANAASFVLLANAYGGVGDDEKVEMVRKMMKERGVKRMPGMSTVRVQDKMHKFVVGDKSHPQIDEVHTELERLNVLLRREGYTPNTKITLHQGDEKEKEEMLCRHSEKLALAYGLIASEPGTTIEVTKNLRMCYNCHDATRFISKIVGRKIIVKDANRIHRFEGGACSCGDFW